MHVQIYSRKMFLAESWNILLTLPPPMVWHCGANGSCFFQRTALSLSPPWTCQRPGSENEKGHSCLPSPWPCPSLPCLAVTLLLATGDLRKSYAGGSRWFRASHVVLTHDHRLPGDAGSGSSLGSLSPLKLVQKDYPETLGKSLVIHSPGRAWFYPPSHSTTVALCGGILTHIISINPAVYIFQLANGAQI